MSFLSLCLTQWGVGDCGQPVRVRRQYEQTEPSRVKAWRSALLDLPSMMYSIKNDRIRTVSAISTGSPYSDNITYNITGHYYYYYSIPREWKKYAVQYKKVQKSSWNEPYSSSSFTKHLCSKMALYRWIRTESRWIRKLISLSSPTDQQACDRVLKGRRDPTHWFDMILWRHVTLHIHVGLHVACFR